MTTADGVVYHVHGKIEGRSNDWTLNMNSGLDKELELVLDVYGYQYCLYGDDGYKYRPFLEIPFL